MFIFSTSHEETSSRRTAEMTRAKTLLTWHGNKVAVFASRPLNCSAARESKDVLWYFECRNCQTNCVGMISDAAHVQSNYCSFDCAQAPAALVGKAFLCSDGVIRWITRLSSRKYFSCLWFDESGEVWHNGGIIKVSDWRGGEEAAAPQKGETYFLIGSTGFVSEKTV